MSKTKQKTVYFIGIGGIGMSALAQWHKSEGAKVSGSDATPSIITRDLQRRGIKIIIAPKSGGNISKDTSLVVYSSAVPAGHPERKKAKKLGIKQQSYAAALGSITRKYKTVAICGTHGKSTTTSMAALIMIKAKLDPTVIAGTRIPQIENSNFRKGKSDWLLIEADEYRGAFLKHRPYAIVCTNVEADHLDYYKNFDKVKKAFNVFFKKPTNGFLILNSGDKFLKSVKTKNVPIFYFNTNSRRAKQLSKILQVPGKHNLANAIAADTLAKRLNIPENVRNRSLRTFKGTWRRFEYKGKFKGTRVYDDYAHHPTEIKAVLNAAREVFSKKTIWCVHQPHHTDRLKRLFNDFTKSFKKADNIIILETYKVKGREKEKVPAKLTAKALAQKIGAQYAATHNQAIKQLNKAKKDDIILITGAGDITEIAGRLTGKQ